VWWNDRVRVSPSAVASCTDPAPANSNKDANPAHHPARGSHSDFERRAKPTGTYEPTQKKISDDLSHDPAWQERMNAVLTPEN